MTTATIITDSHSIDNLAHSESFLDDFSGSENASLGNTAKEPSSTVNTGTSQQYTNTNYRLMSSSKKILIEHNVLSSTKKNKHRTRTCHDFKQSGKDRVTISLSNNPKNSRAKISDVQTCGSWCSCPVCFEKLALENAKDIQKAIAWAESENLIPIMIALTASHKIIDSLESTDGKMSKAVGLFLGGGAWVKFRSDWGIVDYIIARDTTFSFRNGYHPHRHMLVLLDPSKRAQLSDDRDFGEELTDRWLHCLNKKGLSANRENGLKISDHKNASAEYLTKLGLTVDSGGNISYEMTMNDSKDSMHIWDILRYASVESASKKKIYEKLFVEYVEYMSGKTWIRWSKGLRDKVDAFEPAPEEEEATEEGTQDKMVRWLSIGDYWFDVVRASDAYADLVEVASRTRDVEEVRLLLVELRHQLYLSGKWFRKSAYVFSDLNDPDQLVIHPDWIESETECLS